MNLKEKVETEIENWLEYYNNLLNKVKKSKPAMLELADILNLIELGKITSDYNSISITFESIPEARSLLSQIFEKTKIEKFTKISTSKSDRLDWGYHVDYKGIDLFIYPAEPNKDCIAVKKTNYYTSWVCEERKE